MATGEQKEVDWNLDKVGEFTLQSTDESTMYTSIVVCQDKIVVLNDFKVQLFLLQDGQFLATTDILKPLPRAMCLMDAMTMCVLHKDGVIEMVSIDPTGIPGVLKTTRNFGLQGVMEYYGGVVKFKDNLVVVGKKQSMMSWCVVPNPDRHFDTIHKFGNICDVDQVFSCTVTTKDNIVYIAYCAHYSNSGVHASDISNPSQSKYKYKHERLETPTSIVINENGNIFVCNNTPHDSCIHQLTASCQLVAIFTQGIPQSPHAMFWDNERLYVKCLRSREITVFTHLYRGNHEDSGVGTSIAIEQGNPLQKRVEEKLNQTGIRMSTEELGSFLSFQREIGTTEYFGTGPQTSVDGQESIKDTEKFLQECHHEMMDKWKEYKDQGILTRELIDVIYSKERRPELHNNKNIILKQMEQLNIVVKARSFSENGVKEENFFFTPCMLRLESPREVIAPEQDPRMLSTSVLCWVFTGTFLPTPIFDGLLAACLARWPVTKKRNTSKHLISYGCTVFDLGLTHRMTLNCENNVVYARITWLVNDDFSTPDAKLCTRVRMFITRKLSKIADSLNQKFEYELCLQSQISQDVSEDSRIHFSPFQMWFEDEGHDPDSPITPEHMNHARLCVALVTVFGKALREILLKYFPVEYTDIYEAILDKREKLVGGKGRPLLNKDQKKLVFPSGKVEQFDLSLLYTLIRNVSSVEDPKPRWGIDPEPSDTSLGASVERIRSYRNRISGHSPDAKIDHREFEDYWKQFKNVIHNIEDVIKTKVYSTELERQKRQVISVFDAC